MRKSARTQIPPFFDNDPYNHSQVLCFRLLASRMCGTLPFIFLEIPISRSVL